MSIFEANKISKPDLKYKQMICGVYGFEITVPFEVLGLKFEPCINSFLEAHKSARDTDQYNLTAVVISENISQDLVFKLAGVLSFIEHLDVIVSNPILFDEKAPPFDQLPKFIRTSRRHNGGGAMIGSDAFFPRSRPTFIEKSLSKLNDGGYCEETGYGALFFKTIETFRQRKPFVEVSYFLLFSGLETYVRKALNNFSTKPAISVLLNQHLQQLGFNVFEFKKRQPRRSMRSYSHFRNAIFHNSQFKVFKDGITYELDDVYCSSFSTLVALVVMKATGFDDGYINWDAWISGQLLKSCCSPESDM